MQRSFLKEKYNGLLNELLSEDLILTHAILTVAVAASSDYICDAFVRVFEGHLQAERLVKESLKRESEVSTDAEYSLRTNNYATKLWREYAMLIGSGYLRNTLYGCTTAIIASDPSGYLIEPHMLIAHRQNRECNQRASGEKGRSRSSSPMTTEEELEECQRVAVENMKRAKDAAQLYLDEIFGSLDQFPMELRMVLQFLGEHLEKMYPDSWLQLLSTFIFLRFYCPVIVAPFQTGIIDEAPKRESRSTVVLIAKMIQSIASGTFSKGGKNEKYVEYLTELAEANKTKMERFCASVINIPKTTGNYRNALTDRSKITEEEWLDSLVDIHIFIKNNLGGIGDQLPIILPFLGPKKDRGGQNIASKEEPTKSMSHLDLNPPGEGKSDIIRSNTSNSLMTTPTKVFTKKQGRKKLIESRSMSLAFYSPISSGQADQPSAETDVVTKRKLTRILNDTGEPPVDREIQLKKIEDKELERITGLKELRGEDAGRRSKKSALTLNRETIWDRSRRKRSPLEVIIGLAEEAEKLKNEALSMPLPNPEECFAELNGSPSYRHFIVLSGELQVIDLRAAMEGTHEVDSSEVFEGEFERGGLDSVVNRTVFFINLFNCLSTHVAIHYGLPLTQQKRKNFFFSQRYQIGEFFFTLDDIYNGILREKTFKKRDPRFFLCIPKFNPAIHCSLCSYAPESPSFRVFYPDSFEKDIHEMATRYFRSMVDVGIDGKEIVLPSLLDNYRNDFVEGGRKASNLDLVKFVEPYLLERCRNVLGTADSATLEINFSDLIWEEEKENGKEKERWILNSLVEKEDEGEDGESELDNPIEFSHGLVKQISSLSTFFATHRGDSEALKGKGDELFKFLEGVRQLTNVDLDALTEKDRFCLFANVFNCLSLHINTVINPPSTKSRRKKFFTLYKYQVGDFVFSLDNILHGILRGNPKANQQFLFSDRRRRLRMHTIDFRVHFVLSTGAKSSPMARGLKRETMEETLELSTKEYLSFSRDNFSTTKNETVLLMPKILSWFLDDFGGNILAAMGKLDKYVIDSLKKSLSEFDANTARYKEYNWAPLGRDDVADTAIF